MDGAFYYVFTLLCTAARALKIIIDILVSAGHGFERFLGLVASHDSDTAMLRSSCKMIIDDVKVNYESYGAEAG